MASIPHLVNTRCDAEIIGRSLAGTTSPCSGQVESNSHPESYVDARAGAAFLRIHPKTLMRLAREGSVAAYSISEGTRCHWRFLISELDKWMKTKVNSSAHPVRPRPADERRK